MKLKSLWPLVTRLADLPKGTSSEKTVERVVRAFGRAIVGATTRGERISLPGLGVFRGRARKAHRAQLPGIGHHVIEPRVVLTFRAAKSVRILRRGP